MQTLDEISSKDRADKEMVILAIFKRFRSYLLTNIGMMLVIAVMAAATLRS